MPDESGRIRPISVPAVPWHEDRGRVIDWLPVTHMLYGAEVVVADSQTRGVEDDQASELATENTVYTHDVES